ncbi:ComEA family DNA-binding protein [Gordonia sp. CPCC 205333]|uniref:ComEA family DNA-binding protein n=1 Tax=Gordonia sp. CPCC 205333 TaxID=3140790 RepID=UPI003AF40527
MGRNEQLHQSPLSRLGRVPQRPAIPGVADPDAEIERPDESPHGIDAEAERWGIGALPSWLVPQSDSETLPPSSMRDLLDDDVAEDPDRIVDDPERHRVLPAPPAALALVIVGILAVVVAAVLMIRNAPADIGPVAFPPSAGPKTSTLVDSAPSSSESAGRSPARSTAVSGTLVISVVGLVYRPGLVHLPAQARVADALAAAGGSRPGADLLSLNLARPLHDGDQVIVGFSGDSSRRPMRSAIIGVDDAGAPDSDRASAPTSGGATASPGKVNLNTATQAQLDALPGVGPVTATAIIEWRNRNGRFSSVDQLAEVDGIGPGRLAKLRDKVVI